MGNLSAFPDPITRQTFLSANEICCQHATQNLFQQDMDTDDFLYHLIPHPVVHNQAVVFSRTKISHASLHVPYFSVLPECTHTNICHNFGTRLSLAIIQKIYLQNSRVKWSIRILIYIKW